MLPLKISDTTQARDRRQGRRQTDVLGCRATTKDERYIIATQGEYAEAAPGKVNEVATLSLVYYMLSHQSC